MSYREKIAWLSLIAAVVAFVPYFAIVAMGTFEGNALPNLPQMGLFATAVAVQVAILGMGHLWLRRAAPDDARQPLDERDLAIRHGALRWAYYVLVAGMILVGIVMPFEKAGWEIVNAAIFMIVLAEVVSYGAMAFSYRRQDGRQHA